jgi:hypothetical protein
MTTISSDARTTTQMGIRVFRVVTLVALGSYIVHVALGLGGARLDGFFQNWVYDSVIFAAAASCLVKGVTSGVERGRWLCLGFALLAFFAGELYYSLHLSRMDDPPFPSVTDVFYLAFYPAAYAGLVLCAPRQSRGLRANLWLDGIVGALAVAALLSQFSCTRSWTAPVGASLRSPRRWRIRSGTSSCSCSSSACWR